MRMRLQLLDGALQSSYFCHICFFEDAFILIIEEDQWLLSLRSKWHNELWHRILVGLLFASTSLVTKYIENIDKQTNVSFAIHLPNYLLHPLTFTTQRFLEMISDISIITCPHRRPSTTFNRTPSTYSQSSKNLSWSRTLEEGFSVLEFYAPRNF